MVFSVVFELLGLGENDVYMVDTLGQVMEMKGEDLSHVSWVNLSLT